MNLEVTCFSLPSFELSIIKLIISSNLKFYIFTVQVFGFNPCFITVPKSSLPELNNLKWPFLKGFPKLKAVYKDENNLYLVTNLLIDYDFIRKKLKPILNWVLK